MTQSAKSLALPPPVVALAGWLLPGLGYWLIGEKRRGWIAGTTILLLFFAGLLIGGIRVIEAPGYSRQGQPLLYPDKSWSLTRTPMREIRDKPWNIPQVLVGPAYLLGAAGSVWAAQPDDAGKPRGVASHVHVRDIGTLYAAIAGMLNLLIIIDSASRAGKRAPA